MSDTTRFKFEYASASGNVLRIYEFVDAAGAILNPALIHESGTAGFIAALAAAEYCEDTNKELTPARQFTTADGTVAAGFRAVSIHNHDATIDATVLGVTLPAGETISFSGDVGETLGAIAYVTNGAELYINTLI